MTTTLFKIASDLDPCSSRFPSLTIAWHQNKVWPKLKIAVLLFVFIAFRLYTFSQQVVPFRNRSLCCTAFPEHQVSILALVFFFHLIPMSRLWRAGDEWGRWVRLKAVQGGRILLFLPRKYEKEKRWQNPEMDKDMIGHRKQSWEE